MAHRDDVCGREEAIPLTDVAAPSSRSNDRKPSLQKGFLHSIKRNDLTSVRALAEEDKLDGPEAQDELGRTALIVAIDKGNYDMIKCLLDLQRNAGDALFHAVGVHNAQAVRTICKNLQESTKLDVINAFPSSDCYPAGMTPLLLAGRTNDFEIVKILLDHGAKMPRLNDLLSRAQDDGYLKFLATVHWYEASSSEAYILLTSDDPLDTIFKLGESLQEVDDSLNVPMLELECQRIQGNLVDLSVKLLSLARDSNEIGVLLRGGKTDLPGPRVPLRIRQAMEMDSFKKFVCHPSCQDYMTGQWEIIKPHFLANYPSSIKSYLFCIMVVLLYPVLCVGYILLPWRQVHFMKRPKIRFLLHVGSRLTLLCILIMSTHSKFVNVLVETDFRKVNVTGDQLIDLYVAYHAQGFTPIYAVILLWVIGMTFRTIKQLWSQDWAFYFNNPWNVLDLTQLILYWVFVISGIISRIQTYSIAEEEGILERQTDIEISLNSGSAVNTSTTYSSTWSQPTLGTTLTPDMSLTNRTQKTWQDFQAQLVSEASFAVANVLSFLQILHHLIAVSFIGPLLISFGGMASDVLKFFLIFGFLLVSFSIGMTQLYHKFQALEVRQCLLQDTECPEAAFLNFWHSMRSLFWSLFDMMDLGNLKIDGDLLFTATIGGAMYAAFMLVGSIVLLNALIAMMSNTYTRVEENSAVEWKVARTKVMAEYITEKASLPPPFNLVPTVKSLIWLIRWIHRKCCQRRQGCVEQRNHCDQDESQHVTSMYKEVSRALGERCLREIDTERRQSKSSSDIKALKKSVEKVNCDLADVKRQLDCIVELLKPPTRSENIDDKLMEEA